MPTQPISSFKYRNNERIPLSRRQKRWALGLLLGLPLLFFMVLTLGWHGRMWPLLFGAGLFWFGLLWAWFFGGKGNNRLLIGTQYLICGEQIFYYRNLKKISIQPKHCIQLQHQDGSTFTLLAAHFPTGARKPEKIQANQAAKLEKVADKLVAKARACNAKLVVTGYRTGGQAQA